MKELFTFSNVGFPLQQIPVIRACFLGCALGLGIIIKPSAEPLYSINDVTMLEGDYGVMQTFFKVTLSEPSSQPIGGTKNDFYTVYSYPDMRVRGGNYFGTIEAGQTNFNLLVTVLDYPNTIPETNKVYLVVLSDLTGAAPQKDQGFLTVLNDDVGIERVQLLSNGDAQLHLLGVVGTNYLIQASTNLNSWSSISTNKVSGNGDALVVDHDAAQYSHRFYRAVGQ